MLRVIPIAIALFAISPLFSPTSAEACVRCNRDGSRDITMMGTFVRYHPVTFTLFFEVLDEGQTTPRTERIQVVPMCLPKVNNELAGWNSLTRGMRLKVVVHENVEGERQVTEVEVVGAQQS